MVKKLTHSRNIREVMTVIEVPEKLCSGSAQYLKKKKKKTKRKRYECQGGSAATTLLSF